MKAKTRRDAVTRIPVSEYERENSLVTKGSRIERAFEEKMWVNQMIEQNKSAVYL